MADSTSTGDALVRAYLEHLTNDDLTVLAAAAEPAMPAAELAAWLGSNPARLDGVLSERRTLQAVFGPDAPGEPLLFASPFLVFAVAVHHARHALDSATYVPEWLGPGRRAPLFDAERLRAFLAGEWHRFFLAELLASYTHVASGSFLVATRRGWRRQRFSELDPVRLAGLLEVVPAEDRPGVLRRLGDLALFLTGVFPDYLGRRGFGPVEQARLLRAGAPGGPQPRRAAPPGVGPIPGTGTDLGAVGLLEALGRRWYQAAFDLLPRPVPTALGVVGELPERFAEARRILSFLTERYLFPHRQRWFGLAG